MSIYFTFVSQSPNMSMSDHREFTDSPTKNLPNDAFLTLHYMLLYCALLSTLLTEFSIPTGQEAATDHQAMQKMHLWPYLLKLILLPWCLDALMPCTVWTDLSTSCVFSVSTCVRSSCLQLFWTPGHQGDISKATSNESIESRRKYLQGRRLGSQIFCRSALATSPQVSNY